jgi:hypothetical protein
MSEVRRETPVPKPLGARGSSQVQVRSQLVDRLFHETNRAPRRTTPIDQSRPSLRFLSGSDFPGNPTRHEWLSDAHACSKVAFRLSPVEDPSARSRHKVSKTGFRTQDESLTISHDLMGVFRGSARLLLGLGNSQRQQGNYLDSSILDSEMDLQAELSVHNQ